MTSKHRESALVLHGLCQADRQWILERLSDDDQRIVGEHLTELASLGVPAEPSLLDAAAESARAPAARDPLDSASAPRMLELLDDEPDWLVVQILALDEFAWRGAFLQGLSPERRARLSAHAAPLKQEFANCLRARLNRRLESEHVTQCAPPPRTGRLIASLRLRFAQLLSRKHRASAPSQRKERC